MRTLLVMLMVAPLFLCNCGRTQAAQPPPVLVAMADATAKKHGLDPALVRAIVTVESAWKTDAKSRAGAVGLMQVMPATWAWMCKDVLKQQPPWAFTGATDPERNLEVGCAYLAWLRRYWTKHRADVKCCLDDAVIASYNCGQGRVLKSKGDLSTLPAETVAYIGKVKKVMANGK